MAVTKILSLILVLAAFIMGLRHGIGLLRSTPEQVQAALHLSLGRTTIVALGILTVAGAVLVLFPPTFFVGNVLSGAVIFYLAAAQSQARNLQGALMELPFLLLPLLLLYLGYPFKAQP
jgi:Flp pilus assembly protein TadB